MRDDVSRGGGGGGGGVDDDDSLLSGRGHHHRFCFKNGCRRTQKNKRIEKKRRRRGDTPPTSARSRSSCDDARRRFARCGESFLEHQRRGIPFSLEENERRESTSGKIDERDGGRDERTVGALEANARGEKESEYLHFEKKTRILREITDVSREIFDERGSVSRRETRSRGERVGVRVSDFEFCGKGEGRSSSDGANAAEMMTCSATMLRDTCKVIAFCGKDDNTVEITRMVVKMLLALAWRTTWWYSLGRFKARKGKRRWNF